MSAVEDELDSLGDDFAAQNDHVFSEDEEDDNNGGTVMALLASYYGVQQSSESSSKQEQHNPLDLDAPTFDAQLYAKNILRSQNVAELMTHDSSLSSEIKSLDGDMQMLVYENYNKFISATETIRRMKVNVEAMETEMQQLRTNMEDVSGNSDSLELSLSDKRAKMDKLVRVKRLLHRIDFLSELPQRLTSLIENEAYDRAVELYQKTTDVLKKHAHVLSFKRIQEQTEKMIIDVRGTVVRKLEDHSITANKLANYIGVLLSLGAPPAELLSKYTRTHIQRAVKEIQAYKQVIQKELTFPDERNSFRTFHQVFLSDLLECVSGIHAHFTKMSVSDDSPLGADEVLTHSTLIRELRTLLDVTIEPYVELLTRHTRIVCEHNLATMQDEQPNDDQSPTRLSLSVLRQYIADLHSVASEAKVCIPQDYLTETDAIPFRDVGATCATAVIDAISIICSDTMRSARTRTVETLLGAENRLLEAGWSKATEEEQLTRAGLNDRLVSVGVGLDALTSSTFSFFTGCLHVLRPLLELQATIASSTATMGGAAKLSANELFSMQFFGQVACAIEQRVGISFRLEVDPEVKLTSADAHAEETSMPVSDLTCLLLSQVTRKLSEQLDEVLTHHLGRQPQQDKMQELYSILHGSSCRLLLRYIENSSWKLFEHVVELYRVRSDTLATRATESTVTFLEMIDRILLDCSLVLQELPPQRTIGTHTHIRIRDQDYRRVHARSQTGMSVHLDIERLFAQKVDIFTNTPTTLMFSSDQVLGMVTVAVLKSLLEHARLQCFDLFAYSHAQIDLSLIRHALPYFLSQTQSQEALIEQVMAAIGGRCTDTQSHALDGNTLSNIVSKEHSKVVQKCVTMIK